MCMTRSRMILNQSGGRKVPSKRTGEQFQRCTGVESSYFVLIGKSKDTVLLETGGETSAEDTRNVLGPECKLLEMIKPIWSTIYNFIKYDQHLSMVGIGGMGWRGG